jgi:hypothetical protein
MSIDILTQQKNFLFCFWRMGGDHYNQATSAVLRLGGRHIAIATVVSIPFGIAWRFWHRNIHDARIDSWFAKYKIANEASVCYFLFCFVCFF